MVSFIAFSIGVVITVKIIGQKFREEPSESTRNLTLIVELATIHTSC